MSGTNAAMESVFSSLKVERIERNTYRTRNDARADVFDYVELFYDRASEHLSCIEEKDFADWDAIPWGVLGLSRSFNNR
jgi:hypothetical protein